MHLVYISIDKVISWIELNNYLTPLQDNRCMFYHADNNSTALIFY